MATDYNALIKLKVYIDQQEARGNIQRLDGKCLFFTGYLDPHAKELLERRGTIQRMGNREELAKKGIELPKDTDIRRVFYAIDEELLQ